MTAKGLRWIAGLALIAAIGAFGVFALLEEAPKEAIASPEVGGAEPAPSPQPEEAADGRAVEWSLDLEASFARAKAEEKPMLLDFFADWCAPCKELEATTYRDPRVVTSSERFVTLKIDGTDEDDRLDELYDRFGVEGLPTLVFINSSGEVLDAPRALGFVDADELLEMMAQVN